MCLFNMNRESGERERGLHAYIIQLACVIFIMIEIN